MLIRSSRGKELGQGCPFSQGLLCPGQALSDLLCPRNASPACWGEGKAARLNSHQQDPDKAWVEQESF